MLTGLLLALLTAAPAADWRANLGGGKAGSATLTSDGTALHLEVEVKDTTRSEESDPLRADHVELWFALAEPKQVVNRTFASPQGGGLYLVRGKGSPEALQAVIDGSAPAGKPVKEEFCKQYEQAARGWLGEPPVRAAGVFFGLVHYAVYPDGRVLRFDDERYAPTGIKVAPFSQPSKDFVPQVEKTAGGYRVQVRLTPDALLFVPRGGLTSLRVRVDVFDAQPGGKPKVASTHRSPKWADPSTFAAVKLAKPLKVGFLEGLPELGAPQVPAGMKQALQLLPEVFARGPDGWRGVAIRKANPRNDEHRMCEVVLDAVERWQFNEVSLDAPAPIDGTKGAQVRLDAPTGPSTLLIDRSGPRPIAQLVKGTTWPVALAGGRPALLQLTSEPLMGRYTSGFCGAGTSYRLVLARAGPKGPDNTSLLEWNDCTGGLQLDDGAVFEDTCCEPELSWQEPNRSVRLRLENAPAEVEVRWSADGRKVSRVSARGG